jgi:hypothetical protein
MANGGVGTPKNRIAHHRLYGPARRRPVIQTVFPVRPKLSTVWEIFIALPVFRQTERTGFKNRDGQ